MNRKMKRSRLVRKDGGCNIYQTNVPGREKRYMRWVASSPTPILALPSEARGLLRDIFTTLIDSKWRWILGVFSCFFLLTWLVFAFLYYTSAWIHGDLNPM